MVQVDEAIQKAGATDEDAVAGELGFINIHYYAAAVSRYGDQVKGGYQYAGKSYDVLFEHVAGVQTCQDCHDPHSLQLKTDSCVSCHPGANTVEGVRAIRMASSLTDYDGDGDVNESLNDEISGLRDMLFSAIQAYAKEVAGTAIVYSKDAYPYFFIDTNENGALDEGEAAFPNKYASWTPRLEKAAFNFQVSMKDPGGYAHGGKYIIQLVYDSIENLNEKLSTPVDLSKANRVDAGHFDGSAEAFRHWDEDGRIPGACVKCHTADGLPQFIAEGVNISMAPSNGLRCESCHNDLTTFSVYPLETVTFPSGAKLGFESSPNDNLCLNCHQGLESTVSVNRAIAGLPADTSSDRISFRNIHYFAAGATLFGSEAQGVYQYPNKDYVGKFAHIPNYATCSDCHDAHKLTVEEAACKACHQVENVEDIRLEDPKVDYDGDGNIDEGLKGEIDTLKEILFAAIQSYAKDVAGTPIAYSDAAYPYFFIDTNEDGKATPDEAIFPNRYASFTPRLLQAAYNYQYAKKDPGGYVHNGKYIIQVLYDSILDLSSQVTVDTANLKRP
jgi:Zn finger protein HypA/HybF involved in hydrogenase expression